MNRVKLTTFVCVLNLAFLSVFFSSKTSAESEPANPAIKNSVGINSANEKTSVSQESLDLLNQLAVDSFEARERASLRLTEMGLEAKDALQIGLQDLDPEVRSRCRRIWATVQVLDFNARLTAFSENTSSENGHDLPGWDRYRNLLGNGKAARTLFVEMQQADSGVLLVAEKSPSKLQNFFTYRTQQIQHLMRTPNYQEKLKLGSIAALLFAGSVEDASLNEQSLYPVYNLLHQQVFQQGMQDSEQQELLRKLLGAWVLATSGPITSYQNLTMAMRYDLKEGLTLAKKIITDRAQGPSQLQYAILALGKMGSKEDLALLEPLLSDENVCGNYNINHKQITTQIRDVALAVIIHRSGKPMSDFGFSRARNNSQTLFSPYTLGFENDQERQKSIDRWKEEQGRQAKS